MILCRLNKYITQSKIKDVINIVNKLHKSEYPMVRKAVAYNLKYLLKNVPTLEEDGLKILKTLSRDPTDNVKIASVGSIIYHVYDPKIFQSNIWPLLKPLFEDQSWRVRYACIEEIDNICASIGPDTVKKLILPYYAKYMIDDEKELKNYATKNLRVFVKHLDADDIINKIVPLIKTIISDENNYIRSSIAESLLSLAPKLGKKKTSEHILGFFLTLLRDDCAEVRINIFKSFHELTQVLPPSSLIQSIMPVFIQSATDKNWKNRVKTLETLLIFEKELGTDFINDKQIMKILIDSLSDKVYTVRQSTILTMKKLSKKIGKKWCETQVLPIFNSFMTNQNYLYRENALFGIKEISNLLSPETLAKVGASLLELSMKEKVPNVKVLILQTIQNIKMQLKDSNFDENVRIMYNTLVNDPDADVSFYAKEFSK